MDNFNVNIDLIRGHVDTIILRSLCAADKYGYEILKEIEDNSKGLFTLKQPTLYSCLKRLEKQNLISSYLGDVSNGAQRRYYALTDEGTAFLQMDQQQWEFSRTIIDSLLSNKEYDAETPPFDPAAYRPLTKRIKKDEVYTFDNNEDASDSTIEEQEIVASQKSEEKAEIFQPKTEDFADYAKNTVNITSSNPPVSIQNQQNNYNVETVSTTENTKIETVSEVEETVKEEFQMKVVGSIDAITNLYKGNNYPQSSPVQQETYRENENTSSYSKRLPLVKPETVNYINTFDDLYKKPAKSVTYDLRDTSRYAPQDELFVSATNNFEELKNKLYTKGYKLRPYTHKNTTGYYANNFYYSNKLGRDSILISFVILLIQIFAVHFSLMKEFSLKNSSLFIAIGIVVLLPIAFLVRYLYSPTRKKRANFNIKLSLLSAMIVCLNCILIICLIGFFILNVDISNYKTAVIPIIVPIAFLINIPLSVLVYTALYKSKRYHLK